MRESFVLATSFVAIIFALLFLKAKEDVCKKTRETIKRDSKYFISKKVSHNDKSRKGI